MLAPDHRAAIIAADLDALAEELARSHPDAMRPGIVANLLENAREAAEDLRAELGAARPAHAGACGAAAPSRRDRSHLRLVAS